MFETLDKKIRDSRIFAFIAAIIAEAKSSYVFNATFHKSSRPAGASYWASYTYKLISKFSSLIDRISERSSKKYEESLSFGMISGAKNILADSFIGKLILKFNFVYILILYPAVDYALRQLLFGGRLGGIWDEAFLLLLLGLAVIRRFFIGKKWRMSDMDFNILFFLTVALILFMMRSPDIVVAIDGFRLLVQYIIWYFFVLQLLDTEAEVETMLNLGMVMMFFVGMHACYQYVAKVPMLGNWVDSTETFTTRAYSIMFSPNLLGSLFTIFMPVIFAMFIVKKNMVWKLFSLLSFGLCALGLLFTLSRGAWLAAFFGIVVFLLLTYRRLLIPVIATAGFGVVAIPALADRFFRLFTLDYVLKSSVGGRIYRFQVGMTEFAKDPIFGLGMGRYGGAVAMNYGLSPFYMDNYYMKTLVELGIVGLTATAIFYLATLLILILKIRTIKTAQMQILMYGLLSGMVGVLVHNFMENIFESQAMLSLFWVFAGIIMATGDLKSAQDE